MASQKSRENGNPKQDNKEANKEPKAVKNTHDSVSKGKKESAESAKKSASSNKKTQAKSSKSTVDNSSKEKKEEKAQGSGNKKNSPKKSTANNEKSKRENKDTKSTTSNKSSGTKKSTNGKKTNSKSNKSEQAKADSKNKKSQTPASDKQSKTNKKSENKTSSDKKDSVNQSENETNKQDITVSEKKNIKEEKPKKPKNQSSKPKEKAQGNKETEKTEKEKNDKSSNSKKKNNSTSKDEKFEDDRYIEKTEKTEKTENAELEHPVKSGITKDLEAYEQNPLPEQEVSPADDSFEVSEIDNLENDLNVLKSDVKSELDDKSRSVYSQSVEEHQDDFNKDESKKEDANNSKLEKILPVDTDSPKELLRKVLTIMCSIIIVVCLVVLIVSTFKNQNGKGSPNSAKNPESEFVQDEEDLNEYPDGIQDKYKKLYLANKDTVGVISVDETDIEQPIVQYKDNKYYLSHNYYKKESEQGGAFMDSSCKSDLSGTNTVLYVNNNEDETYIFSPLLKYKTIDGYKESPIISFNTLFADYKWKIYACYVVTVNEADDNGYVFDFASQNVNESNFNGYIEQVNMRKFYTTGVDILPTDKLLTIAMPVYNIYGTKKNPVDTKLVILARRLRPEESEDVDLSEISKNANIYKPQAYYERIGKENPNVDVPRWVES